jgi:hypothetical protein
MFESLLNYVYACGAMLYSSSWSDPWSNPRFRT